jgi:hypothetical protein
MQNDERNNKSAQVADRVVVVHDGLATKTSPARQAASASACKLRDKRGKEQI